MVVFLILLAFELAVQEAVGTFGKDGFETLEIGFFVHHRQKTLVDLFDAGFVFPGYCGVLDEFIDFLVF